MKFILPFFLISLLILSFSFGLDKDIYFLKLAQDYGARVSFYTSSPQKIDGADCVVNGNSGIVSCSSNTAQKVYSKLKGIVGISFCVQGNNKTLSHIFDDLKLQIKSQNNVGKITTYLAYTNLFSNHIMLDNDKINIQIAVNDGSIIVGMPIILGSY